jgi:hypothetical protein
MHRWHGARLQREPRAAPAHGAAPFDSAFPASGQTWADRTCQLIQQRLAAAYPAASVDVELVLCAKSGTTSIDWAVGGTLYNAAVARTKAALLQPGAVLGAILLDQGLNDAAPDQWDTNWTAIEAAFRAEVGATTCPLFFRHQQDQTGSRATLRAAQARWQRSTVPKRVMFESPTSGWFDSLHLSAAALQAQAATCATVEAANPIVPPAPAVTLRYPTRAEIVALTSVIELYDMGNASSGALWQGYKAGYQLTQGTTAKQPTYTTDSGRGRPAFRFASANSQCLQLPTTLINQFSAGTKIGLAVAFKVLTSPGVVAAPYNTLVSFSRAAAGNDGVHLLVADSSGTLGQTGLYRSTQAGSIFQNAQMAVRSVSLGVGTVVAASYNNGANTTRFFVQGGLVGKKVGDTNNVTVPSQDVARVGCYVTGASELYYVDGYISGLCFFDGAASDADVQTICRYLYTIAP